MPVASTWTGVVAAPSSWSIPLVETVAVVELEFPGWAAALPPSPLPDPHADRAPATASANANKTTARMR